VDRQYVGLVPRLLTRRPKVREDLGSRLLQRVYKTKSPKSPKVRRDWFRLNFSELMP
jgi:hypothetical protein